MVRASMRRAAALYKKHFGSLLLLEFMEMIVIAAACAPMLFAATREFPWLALIALPLMVIVLIVMRRGEADIFRDMIDDKPFDISKLLSLEHFKTRFPRGLRLAGLLLLWALPFLAATAFLIYIYKAQAVEGSTDSFTVMRTVIKLGGGKFMRGLAIAAAIYAATLIPFIIGLAFHSGTRHALAMTGSRRVLKGRRGAVMGAWFAALVTLIPFVIVAGWASGNYFIALKDALSQLTASSLHIPRPDSRVFIIGAAFIVLCLPLMPLRRLIPACRIALMLEPERENGQGTDGTDAA